MTTPFEVVNFVEERQRRELVRLDVAVVPAVAKNSKSPRMQEQTRQMHQQGVSVRKTAEALGVSRQTVRKFIGDVAATDSELATEAWHSRLNWPEIGQLGGRGVTVKQLHAEYAPEVKYGAFGISYGLRYL